MQQFHLELKPTFARTIIIYCHLNFTGAAVRFFFKTWVPLFKRNYDWKRRNYLTISLKLCYSKIQQSSSNWSQPFHFEFNRIEQCVSIVTHYSIIQWFIRWIAQLLLLENVLENSKLVSNLICSTERGENIFGTSHLNHVDTKTLWKLCMNMIRFWIIQCKWHATV